MEDMTFCDIESELTELASPGIVPGLDRLFSLLPRLGDPQDAFPAVHVVGTNGKGSTCAALAAIFAEACYKTAVYTSPHLLSFGERLRINGEDVSSDKWRQAIKKIKTALSKCPELTDNKPTYFELATAAAFLIIAEEGVDIAIIEAGLGGRYDATNTLGNVVLTLITPIGADHKEYLGEDICSIASEKFAVMRPNAQAIFSSNAGGLDTAFREAARERGAIGRLLREHCSLRDVKTSLSGTDFIYSNYIERKGVTLNLHTPLIGFHQAENASLAVSGAYLLASGYPRVTNEIITAGVAKTLWPGRLEIIMRDPLVIVDGAHNPHAMKRLAETLSANTERGALNVVLAMMKDKDVAGTLELLAPLEPVLFCTQVPGMSRAMASSNLLELATRSGLATAGAYEDPLDALKASAVGGRMTICCGSLFLVGYMKGHIDEITWI